MDRNVFVAIALSMSVLLFWGAFFETPNKNSEQQTNQKVEQKNEQGSIAPTINQPQIIKKISVLPQRPAEAGLIIRAVRCGRTHVLPSASWLIIKFIINLLFVTQGTLKK